MDRAGITNSVKTGLIVCNALSLATIAVSAVVYLSAGQTNSGTVLTGKPVQVATQHEPRLPRARPDEPATTGSLTRASVNPLRIELPAAAELPTEAPPDLLAAYIGEHAAIRACEDKVRNGLALPGSLNRLFATTGVYHAPGNDTVVTFDFDALNGLGFPLEMQVRCVLDHSRIARLEVTPRGTPR